MAVGIKIKENLVESEVPSNASLTPLKSLPNRTVAVLAIESMIRGGVGAEGVAVDVRVEKIAGNHDVGLRWTVEINTNGTAIRPGAENVPFIGIIDAIPICADEDVVTSPNSVNPSPC